LNRLANSAMNLSISNAVNHVLMNQELSEEQKADYIASSALHLEAEEERINTQIAYLKDVKTQLKEAKEKLKSTTAEVMIQSGIDKLKGLNVSSITAQPYGESESEELVIDDEEELKELGYAIVTLDEKRIKQALKDGELSEINGAHLETVTKSKSATIRINKRRNINPVALDVELLPNDLEEIKDEA